MSPNPLRAVGERPDSLGGDERGVSEVLGAVLVFGLVIALLVLVQVTAVPVWNQQVEYQHNLRVHQDIQDFGIAVSQTAVTGKKHDAVVETGLSYPTRAFLLNPAPPVGTLQTSTAGSGSLGGHLRIQNADLVGVTNYWNAEATTPCGQSTACYETKTLAYRPNYNYYRNAPTTVWETGAVINDFPNGANRTLQSGTLVNGNDINLAVLTGSLQEGSVTPNSVQVYPQSAPTQKIQVTDRGAPLTISVPTEQTQAYWEQALAGQFAPGSPKPDALESPDGHLTDATVSGGALTLTFEQGVTYDLQMSEVSVSSAPHESVAYVTSVGGSPTVYGQTSVTLTAQVRDRFNNPVSNVPVTFHLGGASGTFYDSDGTSLGSDPVVRAGEDGRASITYVPTTPASTSRVDTVTATVSGPGSPADTATFSVTVNQPSSTTTGGTGGGINPGTDQGVLHLSDWCSVYDNHDDTKAVQMTFQNDATTSQTITKVRANFYYTTKPGGSGTTSLVYDLTRGTYADGDTAARQIASGASFGSDYYATNIQVADGGSQTLTLWTSPVTGNADDFAIFTIQLSGGDERVYFVPAPSAGTC